MEASILKGLQRVAVVQPLPGIGDMIWHLPHIRAIAAAAGAPVTVIAKPRSAADQLFAADPAIADVMWVDRNPDRGVGRHDGIAGQLRLIRDLRRRRFDAVVLLHHSHTLAFSLFLAGIPQRLGYGFGSQRWFLNRGPHLPPSCLPLHPFDQATEYLRISGIEMAEAEPQLRVGDTARADLDTRLAGRPRPFVTIGIGSSEPYKQWGADRFAGLLIRLADAGWPTLVLVGGPAEAELADAIRSRMGVRADKLVTAIGWSLAELGALFEAATFYVGNDTGVMNMAAASAIPTFGLFGATPPFHHAGHIVPVLPLDQRIARDDGMSRIRVDTVVDAITRHRSGLGPSGASPVIAAAVSCRLCGRPARCLDADHAGYQEPDRFRIFGCDVCAVQFAEPADVPAGLYEHIYRNVAVMPGYARYSGYAAGIKDQPDPLSWLATREDVYWFVAESLRALGVGPDDAVFEIGSGLGYLTYALRRAGIAAIGFDVSETAVAGATEKFGPYFRAVKAGGVAPGTAAVVILTELIEHVADVDALLGDVIAMLAPDGAALVTTPNGSAARLGAVWDTENPPVHLWWFSETAMRVLADKHGLDASFFDFSAFNASRIEGLGPPPGNLPRPPFLDAAGTPIVLQSAYDPDETEAQMAEQHSARYRQAKANLAAQRSDCMGVVLRRRQESMGSAQTQKGAVAPLNPPPLGSE